MGRSGSGFPRSLAHHRETSCHSIPPPIAPRRYSLLRCSTEISAGTRQSLYGVHEDSLDVREEHQPEREQHEHAREARDELLRVHCPHSEEAQPEALHDGCQWIQLREPTVARWYGRHRIDHRGGVHQKLDAEGDEVNEIT